MPCDAACRAKILLNGARVRAEVESALSLIDHLANLPEDISYQLIEILDEAEDKLVEWNRRRLEGSGYKRRTSKFTLSETNSDRNRYVTKKEG